MEILREVNDKWNSLSYIRKIRSREPVGHEEGVKILKEYYLKKYKNQGIQRMVRDIKRRRKHVLEPNSKKSYLFRPLKDKNNKLLKIPSGPEAYDLDGVDAGEFPSEILNDDILKHLSNEIKKDSKNNKRNQINILKDSKKPRNKKKSRKSKREKTVLNTVKNLGNRFTNIINN